MKKLITFISLFFYLNSNTLIDPADLPHHFYFLRALVKISTEDGTRNEELFLEIKHFQMPNQTHVNDYCNEHQINLLAIISQQLLSISKSATLYKKKIN